MFSIEIFKDEAQKMSAEDLLKVILIATDELENMMYHNELHDTRRID